MGQRAGASAGDRGPAIIDLADPAYWQDPHAVLRAARERGDVAWTATGDTIVLRYHEVDRLARDPRVISNAVPMLEQVGVVSGPLHAWWSRMLTNRNGVFHDDLRRLVSRAFTPRSIEALRPRIRQRVRAMLLAGAERGELDVVRDLADPLPIWMMCDLLGIEEADHATYAAWSTDLGDALASVMTPERRGRAERALVGFDERIRATFAERRRQPREDLISRLLAEAKQAGPEFDDTELVTLVINLIFGGHDTSRSVLTSALALLSAHPGELEKLRRSVDGGEAAETSAVAAAAEEVLRVEPPVAVLGREPTETIESRGTMLEAGKMFFLSTLAANRDPEVFEDPDRFDIGRESKRSFSFGWGSHFCLGAALARAEVQETLRGLVGDTKRIERIGPAPKQVPFVSIRRLETFSVRVEAR
ncbi:MAG: cytochrome P450 [Deltaproteobacteria bacterium]|nr:cytochrome P450 [Deltaproteobacteria bacterium]